MKKRATATAKNLNKDKLRAFLKVFKNPCLDVSLAITAAFILISCLYLRNSYIRAAEAIRDFALSYAHVFFQDLRTPVNELSRVKLQDLHILPEDWDVFTDRLRLFGKLLISGQTLSDYGVIVSDVVYYLTCILMILVLFVVALVTVNALSPPNNDYNVPTRPLRAARYVVKYTFIPAKNAVRYYVGYLNRSRNEGGGAYFKTLWIALFVFGFNLFTILFEFLAFILAIDVTKIFLQAYKFTLDISVILTFFPEWSWYLAIIVIWDILRRWRAGKKIEKIEAKDEEYVAQLPVATMFNGAMGTSKTTTSTDIAITLNKLHRHLAFDGLFDNDMKFPYFPWINFENCLKHGIEAHKIVNLASCRTFVRLVRKCYEGKVPDKFRYMADKALKKWYGYEFDNYVFDYNAQLYGTDVYDGLKVQTLFDVLESYAQLYYIYVASTSNIISNYAIRLDDELKDEGNFPLWDEDFFLNDAKDVERRSSFSHRLDFDALRLGKRFIQDNIFKDSIDFGIIVVTEIGKERGNKNTDKDLYANVQIKGAYAPDGRVSPNTDYMNMDLKLIRHRGTVDNICFVAFLADENRSASVNADAKELFDICYIKSRSDFKVCTNSFALDELIYLLTRKLVQKFYYDDRNKRGDNTLIRMIFKNVYTAVFRHYYWGIYNRYSVASVDMSISDGRENTDGTDQKYKLIKKKIHASRFDTACWGAYYHEKTRKSKTGIRDIPQYQTITANFSELEGQHSYMAELMKRYVLQNKSDSDKH